MVWHTDLAMYELDRTLHKAEAVRGADVIVRIEPGDIRAWDFADEFETD